MEQKKKSRKKWIWIGVGVVAVVVIAFGGITLRNNRQAEQQAETGTGDMVTAFLGDLSANATASGQVQAQRDARLSLGIPGEVDEIFVEVGDSVEGDAPLLNIDMSALERAAESAQQALAIQEANYASLIKPPSAADLMAAEASLTSAEAQLNDLLDGPSEDDIAASDANVRAAQANVWAASEQLQLSQSGASNSEIASAQADLIAAIGQQDSVQETYDQLLKCFSFDLPGGEEKEICPGLGAPEEQTRFNLEAAKANAAASQARLDALLAGPDGDAVSIAQSTLAAANAQLDAAKANHEVLLKGASSDQVAAAEANLAQAKANLEALKDGPSTSQVTAAETAVEQARINLQRAQHDLEEATLYAPFAGVVTAVNINKGEAANGLLVEIVDSENLEVVLEVDEVDIGSISEGQPATITLEAWPDEEITGQVASIAPQAVSNSSALVVYEVFLSLGETELPVLVGMTANADLLSGNQEDILLVPNAAINVDRSTGTYTVNLVTLDADGNQEVQEVEVSVGLRDGRFTQIIEGLVEGDQLLVGDNLPVFRFGEGPPPDGAFEGQEQDQDPFGRGG